MTHLDVALDTATAGWPVFPCLPDKRPATRHGLHDAHLDLDRVRSWWTRYPHHLVAVPTAGLVVIDLDEHPDQPGASWRWWNDTASARGWHITDAPIVATPRGGLHIYYQQPEGVEVRNSAGKLASGVDVRGTGGYVIAPGSTLPDGREYELLAPHPDEVPEAPAWLLDLIAAASAPQARHTAAAAPTGYGGTRYGIAALEAELGRLALAGEGTRNDTLVRAAYRAGQLAATSELDPAHAFDQLASVAHRIGLGDAETTATITSGMRSGAHNPRKRAS